MQALECLSAYSTINSSTTLILVKCMILLMVTYIMSLNKLITIVMTNQQCYHLPGTLMDCHQTSGHQKQPGPFTWQLMKYHLMLGLFYFSLFSLCPLSPCALSFLTLSLLLFLPCLHRCEPHNVVLAGLWYDNTKPNMIDFLRDFVEQLKHLYDHGNKKNQ